MLVAKTRGRPAWSPDQLHEVSDTIVGRFFENQSDYLVPNLTPPDFVSNNKQNPMKFALPSEDGILQMVKNRTIGFSDLLAHFNNLYSNKHGVVEKVEEVVKRRCDVIGNQVNWNSQ